MPNLKNITRALCFLVGCGSGLWPVTLSAQTCQSASIPATTPSGRFLNNGDGTVTDQWTGLMWKRCSEGQTGADCSGTAAAYTWPDALAQAQAVNNGGGFAGHTDWRVPNIKELRSLVERQCVAPAINTQVFPGTPSVFYWSSSPYAGVGDDAWGVYFNGGNGGGGGAGSKNFVFYVRLVRGGQ